jgi:hypothetical protein
MTSISWIKRLLLAELEKGVKNLVFLRPAPVTSDGVGAIFFWEV